METITRRGPQSMSQAEFTELRSRYSSTLVDLGTGDGAWPRRFARQYGNCLAIGIDSDRAALKEAAKMAERKPARGGAPNALYVVARVEALPPELHQSADWATIYFPWAALLRMILTGEKELTGLLDNLCAKRSRLSIVLNAEAAPDGLDKPTPSTVRKALQAPSCRMPASESPTPTGKMPPKWRIHQLLGAAAWSKAVNGQWSRWKRHVRGRRIDDG